MISLNIKVNLTDIPDIDASRMQPVDSSTDVGFVITGSLNNWDYQGIQYTSSDGLNR